MRRWDAVKSVLAEVKGQPEVLAAFLKGSLAEGIDDDWSDVDFYCLVDPARMAEFLSKRLAILQAYRPLLYWSESNFVGPQIVAVFEDGLHFDLYTVTEESFPLVGGFHPLYDPQQRLNRFRPLGQDLSLTRAETERYFHEFAFVLLEFEAAWQRKDIPWAIRLASHLGGDLAVILRHIYEPTKARLGYKRLSNVLPPELTMQLETALRQSTGDVTPHGVLALSHLMEAAIRQIEEEQALELNWDMFRFWQQRISALLTI